MTFTAGEPLLAKFSAPIVFRFGGKESEYGSGDEANRATYDKRVLVDTVEANGGGIIFNLIENTRFRDTSWSGRPVDIFDAD